uniref:Uncharacterized protein n=1 Tax=Monodon monoceros TaxID=40151 RepID=A0A8C6BAN7_MONMO
MVVREASAAQAALSLVLPQLRYLHVFLAQVHGRFEERSTGEMGAAVPLAEGLALQLSTDHQLPELFHREEFVLATLSSWCLSTPAALPFPAGPHCCASLGPKGRAGKRPSREVGPLGPCCWARGRGDSRSRWRAGGCWSRRGAALPFPRRATWSAASAGTLVEGTAQLLRACDRGELGRPVITWPLSPVVCFQTTGSLGVSCFYSESSLRKQERACIPVTDRPEFL